MTDSRGNIVLYIAAVVVILLIAGGAWYVRMNPMVKSQPNPVSVSTPAPTSAPAGSINSSNTNAPTDVNVEDDFKGIDADLQAL